MKHFAQKPIRFDEKEFNNKMQGITDGTIQLKIYKDKKMKLLNRILNFFYDPQPLIKQLGSINESLIRENNRLAKLNAEQAHTVTDLRQRHAELVKENKEMNGLLSKMAIDNDDYSLANKELKESHTLDMETLRGMNETICNLQDSKTYLEGENENQDKFIKRIKSINKELRIEVKKYKKVKK
jgi:hypothetical protein